MVRWGDHVTKPHIGPKWYGSSQDEWGPNTPASAPVRTWIGRAFGRQGLVPLSITVTGNNTPPDSGSLITYLRRTG